MGKMVLQGFGRVDILVNNAGIGYYPQADQMDLVRVEEMMQTNLLGTIALTAAAIPSMKTAGSGLIVNIASIAGKLSYPQGAVYSASKFAVMGFSEGLRKEVDAFGIKVATVCPGMVDTDFWSPEELQRREKLGGGKLPPMLSVDDVAGVVGFICKQPEGVDLQDVTVMPFGKTIY